MSETRLCSSEGGNAYNDRNTSISLIGHAEQSW